MNEQKTKRPLLLLDCDGVLSDFVGGVLEIVEDVTGLTFESEDVDQFDFCEALGIRGDDARVIKRAIAEPGFCERLQPYEGARAGVIALQEIADVHVVTTPWHSSPMWTYERESWLWRHFKIPFARVHHTDVKAMIPGDVLIDDRTSVVEAWRAAWPEKLAIRWNTPHNASDKFDGVRTRDWSVVREIVRCKGEQINPSWARDVPLPESITNGERG